MPVSFSVDGKATRVESDELVAHMVQLEGTGGLFEVSGEVCGMCFCGYFSRYSFDVLVLTPFPEHWQERWTGKLGDGFLVLRERAKSIIAIG